MKREYVEDLITFPVHSFEPEFMLSNWRNLNILVFDLEGTGVSPLNQNTRIIQYCGKIIHGLYDKVRTTSFLVNPEIPIPPEASKVNHIFDADVEDEPIFRDLAYKIMEDIDRSDVLCAYNGMVYDIPLLYRQLAEAGFTPQVKPVIDPIVWFRHIQGGYSKSQQHACAAYYKVYDQLAKVGRGETLLHNAENDVDLLIAIITNMMKGDLPWSLGDVLKTQLKLYHQQTKHRTKQWGEPQFAEILDRTWYALNLQDYPENGDE